jgi:hypothetical protein
VVELMEAVRAAKARRDYTGAQQTLQKWTRETIAQRYPWLELSDTPSGLVGRFREQPLLRVELTIHQVGTGQEHLGSAQAKDVSQAITRLTAAQAGSKMLVVLDTATLKAITDQFADQVMGIQLWTPAHLAEREITFAG